MRVKVTGLRELDKALGELPKATARNVLKRVLQKVAEPIAIEAANRAPIRYGDLALSMTVTHLPPKGASASQAAFAEAMGQGASRAQAGAAAHAANAGNFSAEIFIGPGRHPQAMMQEFGTVNHPPQPYMRPTWDARKGWAVETIKAQLGDEIEKSAARLARKRARGK